MNDEQLTAIRARCEAATPGPWRENEFTGSEDIHQVVPSNPSVLFEHGAICDIIPSKADTRFIAHAREDVPALLDEVERLNAIIAHARIIVDEVQLIDNTPMEARDVRLELRYALDKKDGDA